VSPSRDSILDILEARRRLLRLQTVAPAKAMQQLLRLRMLLLASALGAAAGGCPCSAGNYCVQPAGVCAGCTCAAGYASTSTNSMVCAGTVGSCIRCAAANGAWCGGLTSQPTYCPAGTYCSVDGAADASACMGCTPGYFGSSTGYGVATCSGACTGAAGTRRFKNIHFLISFTRVCACVCGVCVCVCVCVRACVRVWCMSVLVACVYGYV
jgi:hypothetical protein